MLVPSCCITFCVCSRLANGAQLCVQETLDSVSRSVTEAIRLYSGKSRATTEGLHELESSTDAVAQVSLVAVSSGTRKTLFRYCLV